MTLGLENHLVVTIGLVRVYCQIFSLELSDSFEGFLHMQIGLGLVQTGGSSLILWEMGQEFVAAFPIEKCFVGDFKSHHGFKIGLFQNRGDRLRSGRCVLELWF